MKNLTRGELRIIAGQWRGRKLRFLDNNELRPTTDRVRETLFNWLQSDLAGSRCIDLFAGSGALGFEAASRGAGNVLMIEQSEETVSGIRENIEKLGANQIQVYCENAMNFLVDEENTKEHLREQLFDIVFMDPPYRSNLIGACCELLEQGQWLANHAKIYIEYDVRSCLSKIPESWQRLKSKKAGSVGYDLYQKSHFS
jgi:16S rRNA (guanine966-N2)-methyltransferase